MYQLIFDITNIDQYCVCSHALDLSRIIFVQDRNKTKLKTRLRPLGLKCYNDIILVWESVNTVLLQIIVFCFN